MWTSRVTTPVTTSDEQGGDSNSRSTDISVGLFLQNWHYYTGCNKKVPQHFPYIQRISEKRNTFMYTRIYTWGHNYFPLNYIVVIAKVVYWRKYYDDCVKNFVVFTLLFVTLFQCMYLIIYLTAVICLIALLMQIDL